MPSLISAKKITFHNGGWTRVELMAQPITFCFLFFQLSFFYLLLKMLVMLSPCLILHCSSISFYSNYTIQVCTTNFLMESVLTSPRGIKNLLTLLGAPQSLGKPICCSTLGILSSTCKQLWKHLRYSKFSLDFFGFIYKPLK